MSGLSMIAADITAHSAYHGALLAAMDLSFLRGKCGAIKENESFHMNLQRKCTPRAKKGERKKERRANNGGGTVSIDNSK